MALIQCHECSGQVSDHARTCPHCGAPVIATIKRRQKAELIELGIKLVFAIVAGVAIWIILHHFTNKALAPLKANEQKQQQHPPSPSKFARAICRAIPIAPSARHHCRTTTQTKFKVFADGHHRGGIFRCSGAMSAPGHHRSATWRPDCNVTCRRDFQVAKARGPG